MPKTDVLPTPRAEVVGSLLRPTALKAVRARHAEGECDAAELKAAEDRAVVDGVQLQLDCGLDVVSDGEMRRAFFCDHVFTALRGLDTTLAPPPIVLRHVAGGEGVEMSMPASVVDRVSRSYMVSPEEFTFARGFAGDTPVKATVSSPLLLHFLWHPDHSPKAYDDPYELFAEAADLLREEVEELARLGCRYVQIDAPELIHVMADESVRDHWRELGVDPDRVIPDGIDIINRVAAPIEGVRFAIHVCRANGASMYLATGGYDRFARELFPHLDAFDSVLLEFDDERSGGFEPLAELPDGLTAVLGLVSTKLDAVEDRDGVLRRIEDASRFADVDRLALSTQCGFASMEVGNDVSAESQEAKLRIVAELAREVWGER